MVRLFRNPMRGWGKVRGIKKKYGGIYVFEGVKQRERQRE